MSENTCKACEGRGYYHTGIDESPTAPCGKCDASGLVPVFAPTTPTVDAAVAQEPVMWREAAKRALFSMDEAVRWRETGRGRPPEQTCMESIAELQALLATPQPAASVGVGRETVADDLSPTLIFSTRSAIAERHGMKVTKEFNALVGDIIQAREEQVARHAGEPLPRIVGAPSDDLQAMRAAFVVSENCGPENRHHLIFKFPTLEALSAAHKQWVEFKPTSSVRMKNAPLPRPGSPEASAMIDSLLAEYQWPSNTKNAGLAGWEAARRWLAIPPQQAAAGAVQRDALSQAAKDVLAERQRQISIEDWTPSHDDEHDDGSLACAAACYALYALGVPASTTFENGLRLWPRAWSLSYLKPKDTRRNLVRAGALIQAEIERQDRAAIATHSTKEGGTHG